MPNQFSSRPPPERSFLAQGQASLGALCDALGFGPRREEMHTLFDDLLSPWGARPIGAVPRFPSDIGDDHSPYEFSIALGGEEPELRILVEAQGEVPSLRSNQAAARELTRRLAVRYGMPLGRLDQLEDLFLPDEPRGDFSLWHAVSCWPSRPPAFKLYLNPAVRGPEHASALVRTTLERLGYGSAWPALAEIAGARGSSRDVLAFVSVDLKADSAARLKVYYRHLDVTASELEHAFSAASHHQPGDVTRFCRAILGTEGPFRAKPIGSCFSFVEGDVDGPSRATLHFPVNSYIADDQRTMTQVERWMAGHRLPVETYRAALGAFATRPLAAGAGMQSYISFRREATGPRMTVYLAPELYSGAAMAALPRSVAS